MKLTRKASCRSWSSVSLNSKLPSLLGWNSSCNILDSNWFCRTLGKLLPAMEETWVQSLGWEDPLEKEMATHSSVLAWRIPRTGEPGRLQSIGSQRVGHDWATSLRKAYTPSATYITPPCSSFNHTARVNDAASLGAGGEAKQLRWFPKMKLAEWLWELGLRSRWSLVMQPLRPAEKRLV